MILATLALACSLTSGTTLLEEFFPHKQGTLWIYDHIMDGATEIMRHEMLAPVEVEGVTTFPVSTSIRNRPADITYYSVVDDTLSIFAYDAKKALSAPRPVLKVGVGKTKWEFQGEDDQIPLFMTCETSMKGRKKVLDTEVDVLELKVSAVLGDKKTGIKFKQTAYYGKGIGLFEMNEERIGKVSAKRSLKLTKFVPAPDV